MPAAGGFQPGIIFAITPRRFFAIAAGIASFAAFMSFDAAEAAEAAAADDGFHIRFRVSLFDAADMFRPFLFIIGTDGSSFHTASAIYFRVFFEYCIVPRHATTLSSFRFTPTPIFSRFSLIHAFSLADAARRH